MAIQASLACWRSVSFPGFYHSAYRAPLRALACPVARPARRWRTAPRAVFQGWRRTSSRASVAHDTTWNGSAQRTAAGPGGIQGVEEPSQRRLVPAGLRAHQPAGVVVDHDGQIPVAAVERDLLDPYPAQPGEPVMHRLDIGPDPGDARPDRAPGDPHPFGHRRLRARRGQPRDLLIERERVTGAVPGPRHRCHHHPRGPAPHPWRVSLDERLNGA